AGQDPGNLISPQGMFSQDINFASCNGQLPPPVGAIPAPAGMTVADLKLALTGQPTTLISNGQCWAQNYGDGHARGYVTMETVNNCTLHLPPDAGYFGNGGTGDATNQNVMNGSYFQYNPQDGTVVSDQAVPIEASPTDPLVSTAGNYTFYGRYDSWTAADNREPLATTWVMQGETDTTAYVMWRDTKTSEQPRACGTNPSYFPLAQEGMTYFGTDSKTLNTNNTPPYDPGLPAPAATQYVPYTAATFNAPARKLGFLYANFNTTVAPAGSVPPADPAAAQSYVVVSRRALGALPTASGHSAVPLDNASAAQHYVPGN
ncbi:MAG: hypothetical protein ABI451_02135, partial [Dokdonella sp.]